MRVLQKPEMEIDVSDTEGPGRRKDGKPHKPGNTADDGSYIVGKARPPAAGQFKAGDGRPRGRRKKGTRNLATDFNEEFATRVKVMEGGKPVWLTRQQLVVKQLQAQSARGNVRAIEISLQCAERFAVPEETVSSLPADDRAILSAYMAQLTRQGLDDGCDGDDDDQAGHDAANR